MPAPSTTSNRYAWIGSSGGLWNLAANWQDLTSGTTPAGFFPGSMTPVTIAGPDGQAYEAIGGGGSAASLGITGNIALSGAYVVGALSIGARSAAGAGYVYAAGAVIVANSLSASTINLASGSLGLLGAGATLSASGTVTLGAQSNIGAALPAGYDPGASAAISVGAGTALSVAGGMSIVQGAISVSGAGASVTVAGPVGLGAAGVPPTVGTQSAVDAAGSIAIGNGGSFSIANALSEAIGSIRVDGAGSRLNVQGLLTIGLAAATGSLGVSNGGAVQAGGLLVQAPATGNPGSAGTYPASITVDGSSSIEIGAAIAAAGSITIDAGKSLASTTDVAISGNIVDNGTLSEAGGNLILAGNLSGSGMLQIGHNGSVTINGSVGAGNSIAFADATGTLVIGNSTLTYAPYSVGATISGFQLGDALQFSAAANSLSYFATSAGTGIVTLLNAGSAIATLSLIGNYNAGSFVLSPTVQGGIVVTLLAPQTGSGGTASTNGDLYSWIGASGSFWAVTTNWQDLTTGSNPAIAFPGSTTPVTITGPSGTIYEVIRGGGSAASLILTGNVDLNGFDQVGAVSIGQRATIGAGSSSVGYEYAAGNLIVGSVVTASTVTLASGSLGIAGSNAIMATSGAVTAGGQSFVSAGLPSSYDPGASVSMNISGGATWNVGDALTIVQGALSVGGAGTTTSVTGAVSLGAAGIPQVGTAVGSYDAVGTIAVSGGGVFSTAGALTEIAGSIAVTGAGSRLTIANALTLGLAAAGGSLRIANGGSAKAGGLVLQAPGSTNPGAAATAVPSILVDASGSLEIGSGTAAAGSITIDAGRSVAATTNATIGGTIVDNGTLSAAGGNLALAGNLSGSGVLQIGAQGTVTMNGNIAAGIGIAFASPSATLAIGTNGAGGAPDGMAGTISGFQVGDNILFNAAATNITYVTTGTNTGRLTLLNAGTVVASLSFAGNYPSGFFFLSPTLTGGSNISLLAPQTGNGGTRSGNADAYAWIGSSGGLWSFGGNWRDVTTGTTPAGFIPGALTPVSITGPNGQTYEAIGGGGSAAGLAITGNIALSGAYSAGALTVGARSAVGTGSSSSSFVYAAGALIVANSLSTGTINLVSGSLGLLGPGAALSASGAITLGSQGSTASSSPASYDPGAVASLAVGVGTTLTALGSVNVVQGSITVSGAGADVTIAGPVGLGEAGVPPGSGSLSSFDAAGSITVSNGGTFSVANALNEAIGSIRVEGAGSRLSVQGLLTLGLAAATGSLGVANGGALQASGLLIQAPATSNPGSAGTYPAAITVDSVSSIDIGTSAAASGAAAGTITIDAGRSLAATTDVAITGNIVDNGTLSEAGGNLTLAGNLSGTGRLQIGHNGSVAINGSVGAGNSIAFSDATGTLFIGNSTLTNTPYSIASPIQSFQPGNSLVFAATATGLRYTATGIGTGTLTVLNGSTALTSLAFNGNYAQGSFLLAPTTGGNSSIRLQTIAKPTLVADFYGDGRSGVIWQNDSGLAVIWEMNGTALLGGGAFANPGSGWVIKGTGDFNGDGRADIVWQNNDGTVVIWEMNGTALVGGGTVGNNGPSWHVAATGDFYGTGKSDLVWQNDDGTAAIWDMNGTSLIGGGVIADFGPSWHIRATGDFNGDGLSDIVWQNDSGLVVIWEMNGTTLIGGGAIGNPGPDWHVKGAGDFNGDGKSDILWQNDAGMAAIWEMNGTTLIGGGTIANFGPGWHIKGTGDYNGDGRADVLWQNDDGTVVVWEMNGTSLVGGGAIGDFGPAWHTIGTDGMRFISGASGNATLPALAAQDEMFVFTSYAAGAHAISGFNPARDLIELSLARFANFGAVQAHSTTSAGGMLIALDAGATLLVQSVLPASLTAGDFVFV